MSLTLNELAARIYSLPPGARERAAVCMRIAYGKRKRSGEKRRQFAGDPWRYFRDVMGWTLTPQQETALQFIEDHERVLLPGANNVGKTLLSAGYGLYRFDAVGALIDDERGQEEQGAQILLPGPDHDTIFATVYQHILEAASRAEARGFPMPGRWSHNSVLWRVRPRWFIEAFSPPKNVGQEVAHTASGRHHRNQVAIIEEAKGVTEALISAVEGMCSGRGNKIIGCFNPTEDRGAIRSRATRGDYAVLHLDAFDHPNVRGRCYVVPEAVDFRRVDERVRTECQNMGPYPKTEVKLERGDFVYAMPESDLPERGGRDDGILGHPDGTLYVYRPRPGTRFMGQVRGRWPLQSSTQLFEIAAWDEAVIRWRAGVDPDTLPDAVGVDVARSEEGDDACAAPRWGLGAESLLRKYAELQLSGQDRVRELRETERVRVGALKVLDPADGPTMATQIMNLFPDCPWNVDDGGVGCSVVDHARRVMSHTDAAGISFGASAPEPFAGLPHCENLRTWMYVTAAQLVALGLADVPDDDRLREEVLAHSLEAKSRVAEIIDDRTGRVVKRRVDSVLLVAKAKVRKKIGRSPDRADTFVLSLLDVAPKSPAWSFEVF